MSLSSIELKKITHLKAGFIESMIKWLMIKK